MDIRKVTTQHDLTRSAIELAQALSKREVMIVFAESCTAGLVSNALSRISGISDRNCGSAVVYRIETKAEWLGIGRDVLIDPGPVSPVVARLMAENVLEKTPEAHVAASVTGHLGPNAPSDQDGLIFVGFARRGKPAKTLVKRHVLEAPGPRLKGVALRNRRQISAARYVLDMVCDQLERSR